MGKTSKRAIALISTAVVGASILTMTCIGTGAKNTQTNTNSGVKYYDAGKSKVAKSKTVKEQRIHCDSLKEAEEITGISIRLPQYSDMEVYAVKGKYIEVTYTMFEHAPIIIRKSADDKHYLTRKCDIVVPFETDSGINAYGMWTNHSEEFNYFGYVGAYFTTEDGTYSITNDGLLQLMDLHEIIEEIANA